MDKASQALAESLPDGIPDTLTAQAAYTFSATRHRPKADRLLKPPYINWVKPFERRWLEIYNIYNKVVKWFKVIRLVLHKPDVLLENVYNIDKTGVMLSMLNSVKVLVSKDDLRGYRGARVKRTIVTAVECISAAVFNPQTKQQANSRPRILIWDGFGTHETLNVIEFCFKNNIKLCCMLSYTSYKLQPCDVAAFGPLKAAYRDQVERMERGRVGTIGKQHFTYLYSPARERALTKRNILAA
ncbi:hypothetical protein K505DRAFT_412019 [Melanomma pulvis-pyrius CBS 109.77]|uniref:DDE-1 domain-containing protein n=1 Tax=Melanomma pulvis-pyrius CBS 109.77 TaxID=1314802 RepID=A0A6A6WR22_9PLEO|nr:hypothetical protein K505DRAFT_412019 [Melanomma pulvis-pyrius CBS 109.77]